MVLSVAPSPLPPVLPPWANWLLQKSPWISIGLQSVLQYIGELGTASAPQNGEWRHVQCVFGHPAAPSRADQYVTTFDIVNLTNGAADATWTDQDYTDVDALIASLCHVWMDSTNIDLKHIERRYYRRLFNDLPFPVSDKGNALPFVKVGGPERVFLDGRTGTGSGPGVPPQVAMTVTELTPYRRHWGRNYWPSPAASVFGSSGYLGSTIVTGMADATAASYGGLQAKQFFPVVPVTQVTEGTGDPPLQVAGLLGVNQIQVDNVADVQRRRRFFSATQKEVR